MADIAAVVAAIGLPVVAIALLVLAIRTMASSDHGGRGGVGSGVFGAIDEVYHPSGNAGKDIREAQQSVPAPTRIPGDEFDLEAGRVRLEVPGGAKEPRATDELGDTGIPAAPDA